MCTTACASVLREHVLSTLSSLLAKHVFVVVVDVVAYASK